jgi:CHAT domain-containing protein
VLVAPDGVLTALPFAALPGRQPSSFLVEQVAIGHLTSGRQLLEQALDPGRPAEGLLAAGGLPYGSAVDGRALAALPGMAKLGELPGTRLEVARVERAFRRRHPHEPVTLLTGPGIDAARLQRELVAGPGRRPYRFVHLATHGFFEELPAPASVPFLSETSWTKSSSLVRSPMLQSGLALAGANREPSKALLTAEEVSDLDLRGAELIVLSACETALGKVESGEGVLGLQRGFHEAGARTLALSLWNVSDAATSVLMEELYLNLWEKKMPLLQALRQAQLTLLRNPARVEERRQELHAELSKSQVSAELLQQRGLGRKAFKPQADPEQPSERAHPALWAAFILSGAMQ